MLDNQAAQTAQECMDRYLLNNTLLAHIFHGPEEIRCFPGVIFLSNARLHPCQQRNMSRTSGCAATCKWIAVAQVAPPRCQASKNV